MKTRKTFISILLVASVLFSLIPFTGNSIYADEDKDRDFDPTVPSLGGAFFTSDRDGARNLDAWFEAWPHLVKFPFAGGITGEWNTHGEAQCFAYARDCLRTLTGDSSLRRNVRTTYPNCSFNKTTFLRYCQGAPAGTLLRLGSWHSIVLLKVTSKEVWWSDCYWHHQNRVRYHHDTVDWFVDKYKRGHPIAFVQKPVRYASKPTSTQYYYLTFKANGATGTMKDAKIRFGMPMTFPTNKFRKEGYYLAGWQLHRDGDNKWCYSNKSNSRVRWFKEGDQYAGWSKTIYEDEWHGDAIASGYRNDTVTCYAVWKKLPPEKKSKVWERVSGDTRYDTMQKIITKGFTKKNGTVIVATGEGYRDALAASGFAGIYDAPVVLTTKNKLNKQAESVLKKLSPSEVYVVGGTAVVSDKVLDDIKKEIGVEPVRIAGSTSAETSLQIALRGKDKWKGGVAIICTNKGYKDALSVAPLAYFKKWPIILSDQGKDMPTRFITQLKKMGIKKVMIVGGVGAVSPRVEQKLKDKGLQVAVRLAGNNGVGTSKKIATWAIKHGMSANNMCVSTSRNYPDALAGAAFCGHMKSVLVLADDKNLMNASFPATYKSQIKKGYVLGGKEAVGVFTWNELCNSVS